MAESTGISWCDATFNPWIGCTKVHAGCTNCYAEADFGIRRKRVQWGSNGTRSKTSDANWKEPLKWNRKQSIYRMDFDGEACAHCGKIGVLRRSDSLDLDDHDDYTHFCRIADGGCGEGQTPRPRVFCASLSDVFEDWDGAIVDHKGRPLFTINGGDYFTEAEYPECRPATMNDLRADLFRLIDATPNLTWMILTKRPENIRRMWARRLDSHESRQHMHGEDAYRHNIWLLTSVSDQPTADKAIPELLKCRDLTPVLGVSAEPLLAPITFDTGLRGGPPRWLSGEVDHNDPKLDMVITGGESGPHARPCEVNWIRDIGHQCQTAGIAWFCKQLGKKPVWPLIKTKTAVDDFDIKPECGELADSHGGNINEWPEDLRVRQFPST